MELLFPMIGILLFLSYIWLSVLASLAVYCDKTLTPFQRYAQWFVVWIVPLLGASFVLHLVYDHSPEAIPESWIPWPFKNLIYGKKIKRRSYEFENENAIGGGGDGSFSRTTFKSDSVGEGGGGDGGGD